MEPLHRNHQLRSNRSFQALLLNVDLMAILEDKVADTVPFMIPMEGSWLLRKSS
jgi:hypothetical protein